MVFLQVTKKFPYPFRDGESWAVRGVAEGVHKLGHEVHLISLDTDKHPSNPKSVNELKGLGWYKSISLQQIDTSPTNLGAIKNLFSNRSYHIDRYSDNAVKNSIQEQVELLEAVDVVIFESLFVLPYLELIAGAFPSITTVYRAHNIEHKIWNRLANEVSPLARTYFRMQASRLKRYETRMIRKVDIIAAVSEKDSEELSTTFSVNTSIPISYPEVQCTRTEVEIDKTILGFLGNMDWRPNRIGITKFIKNIWPNLDQDLYELHIAGRQSENLKSGNGIVFYGEVESSEDFLNSIHITIVPLWSGSGTRVKIIESMAYQVPVISTLIGAEGLDARHGREIMIADSPEEWEDMLRDIHCGNINLIEMENHARDYVRRNHNITSNAKKLIQLISNLKM